MLKFIFLLAEIVIRDVYIRVVVIFDFSPNIGQLIQDAQKVHDSMANSSYFTASATKLVTFQANITKLQQMETGFLTKPPTFGLSDVNAAASALKKTGRSLTRDVQELIDDDEPHALQIAEASGMRTKSNNHRGVQKSSAKNGDVPGEVKLLGEGPGNHQFRYSTDNKTWTVVESNGTSKLTVEDLESGVLYYFQNQTIYTKGRKSAYTNSIPLKVN